MSLRTAQKELTRQRILDAVLDLVAEGRLTEVSVPDVARRSGASVATIYRYFPTKDALFQAAAEEPARRAAGDLPQEPELGGEYLRELWTAFAGNMALLRHQVASDAGREMRAARFESSRRWFADAAAQRGVDPSTPDGRRLVRLSLLLTSSLAFVDLHDRQGVDPDTAAADVTWAVLALQRATKDEKP